MAAHALQTQKVDGVRFHQGGHDESTLVLLHGLGNSLDFWTAVAPAVAHRATVLAPDIPGFGRSDRLTSMTLASVVERLWTFLDRVADGRPLTLVGHSLGGAVAAAMAASRPADTDQLVLVSACLGTASEMLRRPGTALGKPAVALNLGAQFAGGLIPLGRLGSWVISSSALTRRVALWPFVADPEALEPRLVALALRHNGGSGALHAFRIARHLELQDLLASVEVPTRIVVGDSDRLVDPEVDVSMCRDSIYNVEEVIQLDYCGHWPMIEQPEQLAKVLLQVGPTAGGCEL